MKIKIVLIICLILILLLFVFKILRTNNEYLEVDIYRYDVSTGFLVAEENYIKKGSNSDMISEMLNLFYLDPSDKNLESTIDPTVELINVDLTNDVLTLNFSQEYLELNNVDSVMLLTSIVWTFTELPFVNSVVIKVEGNDLIDPSTHEPYGNLNRENTSLNPTLSPEKTEEAEITLYFVDESGTMLVPEVRYITINSYEQIEEYAIEELLKGSNEGYKSAVPKTTKLIDIKTEDGICYINLNKGFLRGLENSENPELTIYAIVNTLTEFPHIDSVQFLIESEKISSDEYEADLSYPVKRNEELIVNE